MDTKKTEFTRRSKGAVLTSLVSNVATTSELSTVESNVQTTSEKIKEIEKQGKNIKRELNRQERKIKGISKECRNNTETNVDLKKDINNLRIMTDQLDNIKINKTQFNEGIDEIMRKIRIGSFLILIMYIVALGIIATMIFM